jgi:phage-related protein
MDVFPMPYGPDFDTGVTPTVRVLESDFGDGYGQKVKDGLNSIKDTWDLSWSNLTPTEGQTAYNFLRAAAGATSFLWMPAFETTYRIWTCKVFKLVPNDPLAMTLTAKFEEAMQ